MRRYSEGFLSTSMEPSGDVVAARSCAKAYLAATDAPPAMRRDAILLLTAALLVLEGEVGPGVRLDDLLGFVAGVGRGGRSLERLSASPMQFVQFVGAELADLDRSSASAAVELCRAAANWLPKK